MGLVSKDQLMSGVGFSAGEAQALEDQTTRVGALATLPSAGGPSFGLNGNIFTFFGAAGNGADTTEDVLKSYSLPANSLDAVGRAIYVYAWGTYANNTNTKAAKLYFGSTSIAAATGQNVGWALEMVIGKSAANAQRINSQTVVSTTHGGTVTATGAETDTAAITIKVTGQDSTSATANAIVLNGMFVNFMN